MAAGKRSVIDSVYIPDDCSYSESDFSFDSDSDINVLDCSSSSDESDHDSINLQSVRQWCKIDMKNIPPPPPVPFHRNPGITNNIANNAKKVPKGEIVAYQRGKVMALKWQDKKSVCLMSTIHDTSSYLVTCKSKKTVMKPVVVCDYNNTMGGVDLCDQEMSYYPTLRKQQGKYYIKIFRQFLDQSLWNAYLLY
ncbi:piggyBac transposable element-derived protein 4 [Trichonephila clavipes]|nr:piggyBac transposable element-derived protein 4 [Trichonephila clavipes]